MAVINGQLGGTDLTNGAAALSADMNDTFNKVPYFFGIDSGAQTWDQTDTTYTELATISGGATAANYAIITINLYTISAYTEGNGATIPAVEIQAGESGSEAQIKEWAVVSNITATEDGTLASSLKMSHTLVYVHTLTPGEKANGLSVIVNGKYTLTGTVNATSTHLQTTVMGIN